MLAVVSEIKKKIKNCTSWSTRCCPTRSTRYSSDCDDTFTSCCKHACGSFGNIKNLEILLAGVPGVALPGAHTIQPVAMNLSQVVNMLAMALEK